MNSFKLNILRGWKTAQPNYVPPVQTPYPGMPGTAPSKVKSNKGCWMALGCGFLIIFLSTLAFFFIIMKIADKKTSPANFITDQFLAHISAGGLEKAYELTDASIKGESTFEDFKKEIEEKGLIGLKTWQHQGAVWQVGGAAEVEVLIVAADGSQIPLMLKVFEFDGKWKIAKFGQYGPE